MILIDEKIPLVEEILKEWEAMIGSDYEGYKNHVYRMAHFCLSLTQKNQLAAQGSNKVLNYMFNKIYYESPNW